MLIPLSCTGSAVLLQSYLLAIGSHKRLKICLTLLLSEDYNSIVRAILYVFWKGARIPKSYRTLQTSLR